MPPFFISDPGKMVELLWGYSGAMLLSAPHQESWVVLNEFISVLAAFVKQNIAL